MENNPLRNLTKAARDTPATQDELGIIISSYLQSLCELTNCFNWKNSKFTACYCASSFASFLPAAGMLMDFSKKEKGIHETIIKAHIKSATEKLSMKKKIMKKQKKSDLLELLMNSLYYSLNISPKGSVVSLCLHSFCNILGIFDRQWLSLIKSAKNDMPGPISHGMIGKKNWSITSQIASCHDAVKQYIADLGEKEGESYAMHFVWERTSFSIWDEESIILELPSSYTKCSLYEKFCYLHGWKIHSDSKGS